MLNSIEESAALLKPDGTVITVNKTFAARIGRTVEECLGQSIYDFIPAEATRTRKRIVEDLVRNARPVTFEDQRQGRWMRHSLSPVLAPDGSVAAVAIFAVDLTERRRRENLLLARQRLGEYAITHSLRDLLRQALDEAENVTGSALSFLHFLDEEQQTMTMQAWSTGTLRTGFTVPEKSLPYDQLHSGVWADCVRLRRAVVHNDYAALDHKKGMPPGHPKLVRILLLPVFRAEKIVAIVAVGNKTSDYTTDDVQALTELGALLWDTLEHKRAQEELAKSEALLNMTQRLNRMGGWQWDVSQNSMTWTRELYRLHGFSPDQFEPGSPEHIKNSLACYEPDDRDLLRQSFENCVNHGVPYDLELTFSPLGGQPMRIRTSAEAHWENGRVSKVLGTFQDITEKGHWSSATNLCSCTCWMGSPCTKSSATPKGVRWTTVSWK